MEVPEPQGTKFGLDQNGEQVAPIPQPISNAAPIDAQIRSELKFMPILHEFAA